MKAGFFRIYFLFSLLSIKAVVLCQINPTEHNLIYRMMQHKRGEGSISISMDPQIEINLQKYILYNFKNPGVSGYRIRIFSGSGIDSKERAMETRTKFISKYEDIQAYIQYDIPNYKVYVGDCRTRHDALKIFELVKRDFPNAFIVEQNINIKD